jgi:hypothetical protein
MFTWVAVLATQRGVLETALGRAWRGGTATIAELTLASPKRRQPRPALVAWSEGASARRAPRWPEVLDEWRDIYDEKLFPAPECPVLAEEVSALGADALIVHGAPGLTQATIGWYARGALVEYEHVGGATVAWTPDTGLGRPLDGSVRQAMAFGGKRLASLVGSDDSVNIAERISATSAALGEVLVLRAFLRLVDQEPPPIDQLNGLVSQAPARRVTLGG